jgi:hypothetical protein
MWIEYEKEKPPESGDYFVKGKRGYKAILFYNAEKDNWELGDNPVNYFSDGQIQWLKE